MPGSAIRSRTGSFLILWHFSRNRATGKKNSADAVKRADAAFHEGFAARQAGNLELARTKFAEVVHLQPKIAKDTKPLERSWWSWANRWKARGNSKPREDQADDHGIEYQPALAYYQAGEPAIALPHFEAALSLSQWSGHPAAKASFFDAFGRALAGAGKPDQAALQFIAEESLTGPRADLEDAIGTLDASQSRWQEAQERFEHAIALDGSFVRARIHLGLLFRVQVRCRNKHAFRRRRHHAAERRSPDGVRPHARRCRQG